MTTQKTATYRFTRANTPAGLISRNRASTDAMTVLHRWCVQSPNRDFKILFDEDEQLEAALTCESTDGNSGHQLDLGCAVVGIKRDLVSTTP